MHRLLLILALLPATAGAQFNPPSKVNPSLSAAGRPIPNPNPVVLQAPFTTSVTRFEDDASTVSHPIFNGSTLVDPYNTWTQNGTVPQVLTSPLYPRGFVINRAGAGPYGPTQYYSLPLPNALNFPSGPWYICGVFVITTLSNFEAGMSETTGTAGWDHYIDSTGKVVVGTAGAFGVQESAGAVTANTPTISCFGVSGTTWFLKVNLRPIVTATASYSPSTTGAAIGTRNGLTVLSPNTRFFEFYANFGGVPSDALFTQIETAFYANPNLPIVETPGTVSHVLWNGVALVDTMNSWTQVGTVPQVPASTGFAAPATFGAGPYSDTNYYSLGTGSDVLDFTGDFTACFATLLPTSGANPLLFSNGLFGTDGYMVGIQSATGFGVLNIPNTILTGNALVAGPNVICCGRSSTTGGIKLNLGTTATGVAGTSPGATRIARLGRYENAGQAWPTNAFEAWFSSTMFTDAFVTSIQNRAFGHVTSTGQVLTVSRSTTATAEPVVGLTPPSLYTWPANILRITENGALLEAGTTNVVLQSEAIDSVSWANIGTAPTVTANQYAFVDGQTSMEKIAGAVAGSGRGQITTSASTTTFAASAWVRSDTGTATESVVGQNCGTGVSACTCSVSSGTCTAAIIAGTACVAYSTVGTVPVRLAANVTCTAATVAPQIIVAPGQYNTTTGTGGFGGAQVEVTNYASSYVPTTTATVARPADVVNVPNPLPVGPFCVTGTWTPASMTTWATANRGLCTFGVAGSANTTRILSLTNGAVRFETWDGATAKKQWDTAAGVLSGATTSTVTVCSDNAGVATATVGGASQIFTPSGVGTGIVSAMQTVNFQDGSLSPVAAVKNFKVCRGSDPARCR